jgi:cholinesterase
MKSTNLFHLTLSFMAMLAYARYPSLQARQLKWTTGETVETKSGFIEGHAAPNASQVSEYLGIPFAEPPLGKLRFAAPVAYTGNTTIEASAFVSLATIDV